MKFIISFSGRRNGNCDRIARYVAEADDKIVRFGDLNMHACSDCDYECFNGVCKYRSDDVYVLYDEMSRCDRVIFVVPMYCGNPSSLYFTFNERCQDYFMHNDTYESIVEKLYIIGVYGKKESSPDFLPCLEKWFDGFPYVNRVLGIERHLYGQKMSDNIIDIDEVRLNIKNFLNM